MRMLYVCFINGHSLSESLEKGLYIGITREKPWVLLQLMSVIFDAVNSSMFFVRTRSKIMLNKSRKYRVLKEKWVSVFHVGQVY